MGCVPLTVLIDGIEYDCHKWLRNPVELEEFMRDLPDRTPHLFIYPEDTGEFLAFYTE